MSICIDYDGDIMAEFSWFICWLFASYMLFIRCILYMDLNMFDEYING